MLFIAWMNKHLTDSLHNYNYNDSFKNFYRFCIEDSSGKHTIKKLQNKYISLKNRPKNKMMAFNSD